jgi:hypothetical protein
MLQTTMISLALIATSVSASLLRIQENTKISSSVVATWPVKAKCQTWCQKSFGDKDPDAVCAYMKENNLACTDCAPCVAKAAAEATAAASLPLSVDGCKSWCHASFGNKDPVQVCAYMTKNNLPCTGCGPCVAAAEATAEAEAKAAAEATAKAEAKAAAEATAKAEAAAEAKAAAAVPLSFEGCKSWCHTHLAAGKNVCSSKYCNSCDKCQAKEAATKAEQLATNENIIKAAADSEMTPLEYAQKVAHLNPTQQSVVALAAAKHAKAKEQKNKAKASHINGIKEMAEEMLKKNNISKEKAAMVAMVDAQEKLKANCFKHGLCVKKGTGELTDEEAMSSYGTPLGVKKVISTECDACPKANSGECVDDSTNYEEYLVYLKCKENAKNVDLLD